MKRLNYPTVPPQYPLYIIRKPGSNVYSDALQFFFAGLVRASKVYAPLYLASLLFSLFQPKNHTLGRLFKLFTNLLSNVLHSSLFLATYCTFAWISWPIMYLFPHSIKQGSTRVSLRRHTWAAGLATLLERKERRPELAAYCATYAIDSAWRRLVNFHPIFEFLQPILSAFFLIASCAILLHHYNKQPALVTKWVLGFNTSEESELKSSESEPLNDKLSVSPVDNEIVA